MLSKVSTCISEDMFSSLCVNKRYFVRDKFLPHFLVPILLELYSILIKSDSVVLLFFLIKLDSILLHFFWKFFCFVLICSFLLCLDKLPSLCNTFRHGSMNMLITV